MRVAHPLMLFSERLAGGIPCAKARTLRWGITESRAGVGCVVALAVGTERGFDLVEPGSMYPTLRDELRDASLP